MKNKKFKKQMFDLMARKFHCNPCDFWFDGSMLIKYEPPCGYCEGDELPFWWHDYGFQFSSLTAEQLKK